MSNPRKKRPAAPPAPTSTPAAPEDSPEFDLTFPDSSLQPPSAAAPRADGEIELDDYSQRSQSRMKIPDQRREKPMFEVAGQRSPQAADARDTRSALPQAEGRVEQIYQQPSEAEIAGYDPAREPAPQNRVASGDEVGELAAATAPANRAAGGRANLDDLDEFLANTANSAREDAPRRPRRPFSKLEWIYLGSGGAILLAMVIWLFSAVTAGTGEDVNRSQSAPDLPIEGSLVTVDEIQSGWRTRKETDRVARMEVFLPKPGEVMPALMPQVKFVISSESKAGYLRFIFRDSSGKPRGDTRVVRVEGGKLLSLDNGEIISSATAGTVYASNGLQDTGTFHAYASSDEPRWSVEVSESSAYDAKDRDWKLLAIFDIRSDLLE
jgi:hypothetical protein